MGWNIRLGRNVGRLVGSAGYDWMEGGVEVGRDLVWFGGSEGWLEGG